MCTADISNMYLNSDLPEPEYVKFPVNMVPSKIITHYNLTNYVRHGHLYARIKKCWYGLKQSGLIAHNDLTALLKSHGYVKSPTTEGLLTYSKRDIAFILVVDDFAIKYTKKEDAEHLFTCLRSKYKIKIDWDAKQFIGINLEWDYENRTMKLSMKGYVEQAMLELGHTKPKQHFLSPSKMTVPNYGVKIQYAKEDTSNKLQDHQVKYRH